MESSDAANAVESCRITGALTAHGLCTAFSA